MIQPNRDTVSVVVQFLQLATLVIGVAGIFLTVGRKDARLETNRDQDRQLDDLRARIARLEPTR
jgi:hypothetical protein